MSIIDISLYKRKVHTDNIQLERCVCCGELTDVPENKPISERKCYVPGSGQLCEKCCIQLYGTNDLRSLDEYLLEI